MDNPTPGGSADPKRPQGAAGDPESLIQKEKTETSEHDRLTEAAVHAAEESHAAAKDLLRTSQVLVSHIEARSADRTGKMEGWRARLARLTSLSLFIVVGLLAGLLAAPFSGGWVLT